jgi:hypothetical protein
MDSFTRPAVYKIRIHGLLGETLLAGFPELDARAVDGDTVLTGVLVDQAALHGVLSQVEALGLELLEVRRDPHQAVSSVRSSPRDEADEPERHGRTDVI